MSTATTHDTAEPVAVLLGHPGIGDAVWHLPVIQAISAERRAPVTVFARASTHADEILGGQPGVGAVRLFERRRGLKRPFAFLGLVAKLRDGGYRRSYVLHRKLAVAAAPWAAGIPERYGLGGVARRPMLNRGPADADLVGAGSAQAALDDCRRFLEALGLLLQDATPRLAVDGARRAAIEARFVGAPRPWIVLGCAAHEAVRRWTPAGFAALAAGVRARWGGTVFLMAGPADTAQVDEITAHLPPDAAILNLSRAPLRLGEAVALLAASDMFVGNDSGPLNLAAAVGAPAWGLFGHATPHSALSPRIKPLLPPSGAPDRDAGMAQISAAQVIEAIATDLEVAASTPR